MHEISEFLRQFWGLWLLVFFIGIVFWVFRPKNKDRLESQGMIPLMDDDANDEEQSNGGRS